MCRTLQAALLGVLDIVYQISLLASSLFSPELSGTVGSHVYVRLFLVYCIPIVYPVQALPGFNSPSEPGSMDTPRVKAGGLGLPAKIGWSRNSSFLAGINRLLNSLCIHFAYILIRRLKAGGYGSPIRALIFGGKR